MKYFVVNEVNFAARQGGFYGNFFAGLHHNFSGSYFRQALNHGLAAWLGCSLYGKVSPARIKQASSVLFLLVGIIIILLEFLRPADFDLDFE